MNAGALLEDKYVQVPNKNSVSLWERIEEILIAKDVNWVIPSFDEMLSGWSNREKEFEKESIKILISLPDTIDTFRDKWETYNAFVYSSLPSPNTSLEKKIQW